MEIEEKQEISFKPHLRIRKDNPHLAIVYDPKEEWVHAFDGAVSVMVLESIMEKSTVENMIEKVVQNFGKDVSKDEIVKDIFELVNDLQKKGLIDVR